MTDLIPTQYIVDLDELERWGAEFRAKIRRIHAELWELIDHLTDGYERFGEDIYQYIDPTDLSIDRLRNYLTTGKNFPPSRRGNLPALSPSHFETVNPLPFDLQDELLQWAYETGASRDELRRKIRELNLTTVREPGEVYLENDALVATNERLRRENEGLKAQVAKYQEQHPADEAWSRDTCPECGGERILCQCSDCQAVWGNFE